MQDLLNSIIDLKDDYQKLSTITQDIFNAMKTRQYERKSELEKQADKIYNTKEKNERRLIQLVKSLSELHSTSEERIESLLELDFEVEIKMAIKYELSLMLESINSFKFNLARNIEYANVLLDVRSTEMDIIFEAMKQDNRNSNPILVNKEF